MKAGETRYIARKLDLEKPYDDVRFRLSNGKTTITRTTKNNEVVARDGVFLIPLYQKDTVDLQGRVTIEAEIDYGDKSVIYSDDTHIYINDSLGWSQVSGSAPAEDDGIEVVMTAIEEGVAVIVNPEASQELIDAVTELFQDTKQIAQSVRDDADNGEFDGYSPQVTVKTETPSTYVLHIKDADHEFDTPNLQGQGGEGTIEAGDGLQRVANVISVKRKQNGYILVTEDGLYIDVSGIAYDELLRGNLTIGEGALASKSYVDNLIATTTKWEFVSQLPTENIDKHTVYFVPKATAETDNLYDEWVYAIKSRNPDVYDWELIGTTEVDLSNYYTKTESDTKYQNKLNVGNGIKIINNVISVDSRIHKLFDLGRGGVLPTDPSSTLGSQVELYDVARVMDNASPYNVHLYLAYSISSTTIEWIDYFSYMGIASNIALGNKQDTIDSTHKLDADNVDDSTSTNKFVTSSEKSTWNGKEDKTTISTDTTSTTVSLTLADNHEYRFTQDLTSLTLTMPNGDFISSIVFASGSTPTSMTYDSSIKWSGDDVTNGQFVPTEKTYNIVMWYDGLNVNGVVRGV